MNDLAADELTIKVTSVFGNSQRLDGGSMFGNVPRPLWTRWFQPDELGRIELACRCLLIQIDDIKILCETGIGAYMSPDMSERFGVQNSNSHQLLQNLYDINVSQEEIDYVVLSHLHFDHAGGLLPPYSIYKKGLEKLVFPNAHFVVGQEAFERAKNPHMRDRASFIPELPQILEESGRLIIIDAERSEDFFPENIRFMFTDGHTPGQMHLIIQGKKYSMIFAGDLIPGISWIHLPITMGYDRYPEKLIDEKKTLYQSIDAENTILFYTHDPKYAGSRVLLNENGKYEASKKMDSFNGMIL